jgi:hypothetical protein
MLVLRSAPEVATMTETKRWTVGVIIDEDPGTGRTRAQAALQIDGVEVEGEGEARRDPGDAERASIGDKIAVARAMLDLAQSLLKSAEAEIAAVTHQPAHVHR